MAVVNINSMKTLTKLHLCSEASIVHVLVLAFPTLVYRQMNGKCATLINVLVILACVCRIH